MKAGLLPDAELALMEGIWAESAPVTTAVLMHSVGATRGWKIQTLSTLLKRLVAREFLSVQKGAGRELLYTPLVTREAYVNTQTRTFLNRVHMGSFSSFLSAFGASLTHEELSELEEFVSSAKEEGL